MSKFTLFWIATYCFGLFGSFVNPVLGTYAYVFEYYLRPSLHWWGKPIGDFRFNMIISAVLTATFLMRRNSLQTLGPARHGPAHFLVALGALMILTLPIAINTEESWRCTTNYLKFILFHGLIVGTVRNERLFDAFIGLHMAGTGYWAWEAYTNPKREQSRLVGIGSGDTLGDNFAAAHLLTVIPFIAVYLLMAKDKKLRLVALGVAPFVLNLFILCNSRGSFLGLIMSTVVAFLLSRGRHKVRVFGAIVAGGIAFLSLADPEFIARQQTTSKYEDDGSAQDRLYSWRAGVNLIKDFPFGAGGSGYEELSPVYAPVTVAAHGGAKRAPHNTYILVASEWGILGLILFLGYYVSAFRLASEVRRRATGQDFWYYRALALQCSMVGLLVAGTFSDRLYAEAPYWIGALSVVLHRLQTEQLAQQQEAPGTVEAATPTPSIPLGAQAAVR